VPVCWLVIFLNHYLHYVCVVITFAMVMVLRDFGPYGIIFVCCYNLYHGNGVKGFWALWDNIYEHVLL
jgi:hypothetical protein